MLNLNRVQLAGNVGADPEIKTMQSGDKVANFSVATKESWKDKNSGEWKESTEWHRVVIFNQAAIKFVENHVKKGSQVFVEGRIETRSWEQDGQKRYSTEIVVRPYDGQIQLIDKFDSAAQGQGASQQSRPSAGSHQMDDEIPFDRDRGPAYR